MACRLWAKPISLVLWRTFAPHAGRACDCSRLAWVTTWTQLCSISSPRRMAVLRTMSNQKKTSSWKCQISSPRLTILFSQICNSIWLASRLTWSIRAICPTFSRVHRWLLSAVIATRSAWTTCVWNWMVSQAEQPEHTSTTIFGFPCAKKQTIIFRVCGPLDESAGWWSKFARMESKRSCTTR